MQGRCSSRTSLCGSRFDSRVLGPDVLEDEPGDEESEKDSNENDCGRYRDRYRARGEGSGFEGIMSFRMP